MKNRYFSSLKLTVSLSSIILAWIFMPNTASAYVIYNDSKTTITVLQLPLSDQSFTKVIQPGKSEACHWSNRTCVAKKGRYEKTPFMIYRGDRSKELLSLKLNNIVTLDSHQRKINSQLYSTIKSILDIPGIPSIQASIAKEIYSVLDPYVSKKLALGVVQTYNGGIITVKNNSSPLGCWNGPCLEQDVNQDGSRGYKLEN